MESFAFSSMFLLLIFSSKIYVSLFTTIVSDGISFLVWVVVSSANADIEPATIHIRVEHNPFYIFFHHTPSNQDIKPFHLKLDKFLPYFVTSLFLWKS